MSKLKEQLKRHEGLRLKPYYCPSGKLTIGYGRNLTDVGISTEEAETLLDNDIKNITEKLSKALPWFNTLDPVRRDCLINMAYNLGVAGLLKWHNTLNAISQGNYKDAARRMRASLWASQVKSRAEELAEQMEKGEYRDERKESV